MKSDSEFYRIFHDNPELLPCLLPLDADHNYTFTSLTMKQTERRLDGFVSCPDPKATAWAMEFQVDPVKTIKPRMIMEGCSLQLEDMERPIKCMLVFLTRKSEASLPGWEHIFTPGSSFVKMYLDERLKELGEDHPLTATFAPFFEEDPRVIQDQMKVWHQHIHKSHLSPDGKQSLEDVFLIWLKGRLSNYTAKEVYDMLSLNVPFEETAFYKDIAEPFKKELRQKDEALSQKDEALSQKDEALSQKDEALFQKDEVLSEYEATIKNAAKLLLPNQSIEEVSQSLGLSLEKLKALLEGNN